MKNGAVWDNFGVFLAHFGVIWDKFGVVWDYFGNMKTQKSRIYSIKNTEITRIAPCFTKTLLTVEFLTMRAVYL